MLQRAYSGCISCYIRRCMKKVLLIFSGECKVHIQNTFISSTGNNNKIIIIIAVLEFWFRKPVAKVYWMLNQF